MPYYYYINIQEQKVFWR